MCGRYSISEQDNAEIREIIQKIHARYPAQEVNTGEIFPANTAPVLSQAQSAVSPVPMRWGFPNFRNKRLLINARAETVLERPAFRDSVLTKRCAVPSTGFYEWDKDKQKYSFRLPGQDTLYMAGIWKDFGGVQKYVILTTAPNASVAGVHGRMPLVLPNNAVRDWILDSHSVTDILQAVPPILVKTPIMKAN